MKPTLKTHGCGALQAAWIFLQHEKARHEKEKSLNEIDALRISVERDIDLDSIEASDFITIDSIRDSESTLDKYIDDSKYYEFRIALYKSEADLHQKDIEEIQKKIDAIEEILKIRE